MFLEERKREGKNFLQDESENLAVPEVHIGEAHEEEPEPGRKNITYENVAIPEIHVHRKKK